MANPGSELASLDFGNLIGGPLVAVITAQSLAAEATAKFIKGVGFYPDNQPPAADGTLLAGNPIYVDFKYPKEVQPYQPKVDAVAYVAPADAVGDPVYQHGMKKPDGSKAETAWTDEELAAAADNDNADAHPDGLPIYVPAVIGVAEVIGKDAVPAVYQEMKISVPILTMLPIPFIKVDIITIDFNAKITSTDTTTSSSDVSVSGTVNARYGVKVAAVSFSGTVAYKKSTTSGSSVERTYSMAIHVQASQDEMPAGMEKLLSLLEGAMIASSGAVLLRAKPSA